MKNLKIYQLTVLVLIAIAIIPFSCKKELVTEEPEAVYDQGERLKLSNNLVILEESELTHSGGESGFFFDETTTNLRVDVITVETELDTGMVLHIDTEDGVLLRRITDLEMSNGEYVLKTSPGNVTDVFDDADINFDFSPVFSSDQLKTKSLSGMEAEELSRALTDKDNSIHPSEVTMIMGDTRKVLFSVDKNIPLNSDYSNNTGRSANSDGEGVPLFGTTTTNNKVGFEHQFNTDKTIMSVGPVELVLQDFGFSWYSDLKANFYTEKKFHHLFHHKVYPPYYIGAKFDVTASDMDIKAWFDVAAVVEGEFPLANETDPLLLPITIQFEFPVGAVPVLIGIEFALDLGIEISVDGKAQVSTGYTVEYNVPKLMVGGYYSIENLSSHSGVRYDYKEGHIVDQYFHPLKLEAMATVKQVYTLKPTMGFSIYRLAGPEINLALGSEFDFSVGGGVSFDLEDGGSPEAYIGWGGDLSTKVGAGGGAWIDAFGALNKHWDIPTLTLLPNIPIWHTPESMEKVSDNNFSNTVVGESKEVEVKVKDNWTLPSPMMFVEWVSNGGGHWEKPITLAITGTSKNTWIPEERGTHSPYCYVKNGSLKEKGRITFSTTTTDPK